LLMNTSSRQLCGPMPEDRIDDPGIDEAVL
jgi:hypothetical protein